MQVRIVVCEWLAWLLRIKRPGRELSLDELRRKHRVRQLEALIPPSASLISNVKDIDNTIPLAGRASSRYHQSADPETNNTEATLYPFATSPPPFLYGLVSPFFRSFIHIRLLTSLIKTQGPTIYRPCFELYHSKVQF